MTKKLIIVMCLSLAVLTGCETDKKNLEKAKVQISELTIQNQQLSNVKATLETEKATLTEELGQLKNQNGTLSAQVDELRKNLSELFQKNEVLQKKADQTSAEVVQLKKQKDELKSKIAELNKKVTPNPDHVNKFGETDKQAQTKQQTSLSPCEALVEYMKQGQSIIKGYKGEERKSKLEEARASLAAKMNDAPLAGKKAAIEWVKELNRSWDRHQDDGTPRLVRLKDAALKACGKTAAEAGF